MSTTIPRVSVGLPVYNGENFLAEAIESVLGQTFRNWELIISDNASTDRTQELCQSYAAQDQRIRYVRNRQNIGAAGNFNQVFTLASSEYFQWLAHDDRLAPTFIERCVEVLDCDPSVVLCYTRSKPIDAYGEEAKDYHTKFFAPKLKVGSSCPQERFYDCVIAAFPTHAVFGLIRSCILATTSLIGSYTASDIVLLGELALRGRLYEIPEVLQYRRLHEQQSWRVYRDYRAREAWFDPRRAGKRTLPHWRLLNEHLRAITESPLTWTERMWCYIYMWHWVMQRKSKLTRDLIYLLGVGASPFPSPLIGKSKDTFAGKHMR